MKSTPFLFSGINPSISELNEKLDRLGGGDARVAGLEVHALIGEREDSANRSNVLWAGSSAVGVRNIDLPEHASESDKMRYFEVTSASTLIKRDMAYLNVMPIEEVSNWIKDGFNASVITFGSRGSYKSSALFGKAGMEHNCLAGRVLHKFYDSSWEGSRTIGLSCWCLLGNSIIDLLDIAGRKQKSSDNFISVECRDLDSAISTLSIARDRAPGARAYSAETVPKETERAHFFCRIVIHRPDGGLLSSLHLVDLVGAADVGNVNYASLDEESRIARRNNSVQLSILTKVLQQMKSLSVRAENPRDMEGSSFSSEAQLTSARESKLTQLLAPILQGNSKTWIVSFLVNGEKHYEQSLNSLRALDGLVKIRSACHRVKNVPIGTLNLKQHRSILPVGLHWIGDEPEVIQSAKDLSPTPKGGRIETMSDGDTMTSETHPMSQGVPELNTASSNYHEEEVQHLPESVGSLEPKAMGSARFDSLMNEFDKFKDSFDDFLGTSTHHAPVSSPGVQGENPLDCEPSSAIETFEARNRSLYNYENNHNLTPYYHTISGSSPIEELLRQEMKNDAMNSANQFNESRNQFDGHNFIMKEYEMNDAARNRGQISGARIVAEGNENVLRRGTNYVLPESSDEIITPHLENQGQYYMQQFVDEMQHHNEQQAADHTIRSQVTEWFDSTGNTRIVNIMPPAEHPTDPTDEGNPLSPVLEAASAEDFPLTASLARRTSDESLKYQNRTISSEPEIVDNVVDQLASAFERAELSSDVDELQKLNRGLMSSLQREYKVRQALTEKMEAMSLSFQEERKVLALHLDDMNLECSKLRQIMRRLAKEASLADVLKYFEDEMKILATENSSLRRRNLFLEDHNEYIATDNLSNQVDNADYSSMSVQGAKSSEIQRSSSDHVGEDNESTTPSKRGRKTVANRDIAWNSMDGMTSCSGTENAEIRVLKASLRKARKEVEIMSSKMDDAKKIERRGTMCMKLYEDCNNKLVCAQSEVERLSKEVDFERDQRFQRERDISILQGEVSVLQSSERELRNERSRNLSQLAGMRQRIRELEIERTKYASFDRFVKKHTASKWGDKPLATEAKAGSTRLSNVSKKSSPYGTRKDTSKSTPHQGHDTLDDTNQYLTTTSFETPGMASRLVTNGVSSATTPHILHKASTKSSLSTKKGSPPQLPIYRQSAQSRDILKLTGNNSGLLDMTDSQIEKSLSKGVVGVAGLSNAQVSS